MNFDNENMLIRRLRTIVTISQTADLRAIEKKYNLPDRNNEYLDEINTAVLEVEEVIQKRINIIAHEISNILIK